ncbi:hypothetical protein BH23ACT10_BH23ACT10_17150 [soil metagenome]
MAEEQYQLGLTRIVPTSYDWPSLLELKGEALEAHYIAILNELGRGEDMLGVVFRKAQNRIRDPAKLERLIKDAAHRNADGPAAITLPGRTSAHVDYSYARTVDTAQGATVDHSLFTPSANTRPSARTSPCRAAG